MDTTEMLRQAVAALAVEDRTTAMRLLAQVLQADPRHEAAWLWMAHAVGDSRRARECIEHVLAINPRNEEAKQLIESFERRESLHRQVGTAQGDNLAWFCPKCRSRNMTPIRLRVRARLRCPNCGQEYECISGEAVWGQCDVDRAVWSQWFDWIIRLRQANGSVAEVAFTLHRPDFTIAVGDFLVVLMKKTWSGQEKVVQVDNKTTGNVIRPGK